MRAIGITFQKGRVRITVLDGNAANVTYHAGRAVSIDPDLPLPELMERYATQIRLILDEFKPNVVAVRQVWESKNVDAATCQVAPVGITAYVCQEKGIAFEPYTPQALRQPTPFGLAKGLNPLTVVDERFGQHPPYWDDMQKSSVLAAWRALLEHK